MTQTINSALIPFKAPGTIFDELTGGDDSLSIRWLTAGDPAYYAVLNRPIADLTVRQLVIAKALDSISGSLGNRALFPFIIQPRITSNTTTVDLPASWIWDIHVSMPKKWENVRLAKIKRISGVNSATTGYTGKLRLIFTATQENSTIEKTLFYADYDIESLLTFQVNRITVSDTTEESNSINSSESETISGFIIFKTLNQTASTTISFYELLSPAYGTDSNNDGYYESPEEYEIDDNTAGGYNITGDVDMSVISHGTGLLTSSAWNAITSLDSDINNWLIASNYPYNNSATRTSTSDINIPTALFKEFNITAPAGDEQTGDVSGLYFPVWVSKVEKVSNTNQTVRFVFSTYNTTESETGGSPSTDAVEFATLDLSIDGTEDDIVSIYPINNLKLETSVDFNQHFGRGQVVLSSNWSGTNQDITDFFNAVFNIPEGYIEFTKTATRLSSFAISRIPKYVPTIGQSRALLGSTSRRSTPINPSENNRYVCEQDVGVGDKVDLESQVGIVSHPAFDKYGYTGNAAARVVKLVIDPKKITNSATFYEDFVLPRLVILFNRQPAFGDVWYDGTRFNTYNGDAWQS